MVAAFETGAERPAATPAVVRNLWVAVSALFASALVALLLVPTAAGSSDGRWSVAALGDGPMRIHIHAHVTVLLDGNAQTIPAGLGFTRRGRPMEVHTHDDSGVLHLESTEEKTFVLGQLFWLWARAHDDRRDLLAGAGDAVEVRDAGGAVLPDGLDAEVENRRRYIVVIGSPSEV